MEDRYGFDDSRDFRRPEKNNRQEKVFRRSDNAILVLMEPLRKQFGDVGIRSLTYNFHAPDFVRRGEQFLSRANRGSHSVSRMSHDLMSGLEASDHITPTSNTSRIFKASNLSDHYRFILILTSDPQDRIMDNTRIRSRERTGTIRKIYTGFCIDEPLGRGHSDTRPCLNDRCRLEITRKMVTEVEREDTQRGALMNLKSRYNDEYINPILQKTLSDQNSASDLHLLLPERISQGVVIDGDNISSAPGLATDISSEKRRMSFAGALNDPRTHLKTIARAFTLAQDDQIAQSRVSGYRRLAAAEDPHENPELQTERVSNYLHVPTSARTDGLDLDTRKDVLLGDIDDTFDPKVLTIRLEDAVMYDTADHEGKSLVDKFSYLVAIVTPVILNSIGLNEVTFTYACERVRGGLEEEMFKVRAIEPVCDVNEDDLDDMESAFKSEMRASVLRNIFQSAGDFHLMCECDVTGFTTVRLNLLELGRRTEVDFEIPTLFGGNISPFLGGLENSASNTDHLADLWGTLLGMEDADETMGTSARDFYQDDETTHEDREPDADDGVIRPTLGDLL